VPIYDASTLMIDSTPAQLSPAHFGRHFESELYTTVQFNRWAYMVRS